MSVDLPARIVVRLAVWRGPGRVSDRDLSAVHGSVSHPEGGVHQSRPGYGAHCGHSKTMRKPTIQQVPTPLAHAARRPVEATTYDQGWQHRRFAYFCVDARAFRWRAVGHAPVHQVVSRVFLRGCSHATRPIVAGARGPHPHIKESIVSNFLSSPLFTWLRAALMVLAVTVTTTQGTSHPTSWWV